MEPSPTELDMPDVHKIHTLGELSLVGQMRAGPRACKATEALARGCGPCNTPQCQRPLVTRWGKTTEPRRCGGES